MKFFYHYYQNYLIKVIEFYYMNFIYSNFILKYIFSQARKILIIMAELQKGKNWKKNDELYIKFILLKYSRKIKRSCTNV